MLIEFFTKSGVAPPVNSMLGDNESHRFGSQSKDFVVVASLSRSILTSRHRVRQMNEFMGNNPSRIEDPLADRSRCQHNFVQFHGPLLPPLSGVPPKDKA